MLCLSKSTSVATTCFRDCFPENQMCHAMSHRQLQKINNSCCSWTRIFKCQKNLLHLSGNLLSVNVGHISALYIPLTAVDCERPYVASLRGLKVTVRQLYALNWQETTRP